jgi:hypothetical protein
MPRGRCRDNGQLTGAGPVDPVVVVEICAVSDGVEMLGERDDLSTGPHDVIGFTIKGSKGLTVDPVPRRVASLPQAEACPSRKADMSLSAPGTVQIALARPCALVARSTGAFVYVGGGGKP